MKNAVRTALASLSAAPLIRSWGIEATHEDDVVRALALESTDVGCTVEVRHDDQVDRAWRAVEVLRDSGVRRREIDATRRGELAIVAGGGIDEARTVLHHAGAAAERGDFGGEHVLGDQAAA